MTAVEWLIEQYAKKGYIGSQDELQAKEMEKQQHDKIYDHAFNYGVASSQTEISDEEILEESNYRFRHFEQSKKEVWANACKWYREQLKKKQ